MLEPAQIILSDKSNPTAQHGLIDFPVAPNNFIYNQVDYASSELHDSTQRK